MAEEAARAGREGGERVRVEDARAEPGRPREPARGEAPAVEAVVEGAVVALGAQLRHAVLVDAVVAGDAEERPAFTQEAGARERARHALLPAGVDHAAFGAQAKGAPARAAGVEELREGGRHAEQEEGLAARL